MGIFRELRELWEKYGNPEKITGILGKIRES